MNQVRRIQPDKDVSLQEFLTAILPSPGPFWMIARADRHGKPTLHESFDSIDDMAARIKQLESESCQLWFAPAAYAHRHDEQRDDGDRWGRKKENVSSLSEFHLDIDISTSESKSGYATLEIATQSLEHFIEQFGGLGYHIIVQSGGGLHVYWLLDSPIERKEWELIANKLKIATEIARLRADRSRTTDAASLLRPIGTTNRKQKYGSEGRPVSGRCVRYGRISAVEFEAACDRLISGALEGLNKSESVGQVTTGIQPVAAQNNNVPAWFTGLESGEKEFVIRSMLAALAPSCVRTHDEWLRIGASLSSEETLPKDSLFELWAEWSQSTPEGKESWGKDTETSHRGRFDSLNRSSLGALIKRAENSGWHPDLLRDNGTDSKEHRAISVAYETEGARWTLEQAKAYLRENVIYVETENGFLHNGLLVSKDALDTSLARHMPIDGQKRINPSALVKDGASPVVQFIGYKPGAPRMYIEGGYAIANTYCESGVVPVKPSDDDAQTIKDFILHLASGDDETKKGILLIFAKLAWLHRYPCGRIRHATLLVGKAEGCGKSTLTLSIPRAMFGKSNVRSVETREVSSDFNGYANAARILCFSELWLGNRKDAQAQANNLKPLIADDWIAVIKKGKDGREVENVATIFANSNHEDAAFIGESDRRYHVLATSAPRMPNELAKRIYDLIENRPGSLLWLVLHLGKNGEGFNPNDAPPKTNAKHRMLEANRAPWAERLHDAHATKEGPFAADAVSIESIKAWLGDDHHPKPSDKAIRDELMRLAPDAQPMQAQKRVGGTLKSKRLFVIRNVAQWEQAGPAALYEDYEKQRQDKRHT